MRSLVELVVGGSDTPPQTVGVEIEQVGDGLVEVARPGQVVARATRSLRETLATGLRPLAEDFVAGFRDMRDPPEEIAIEFGLSLSTEADLVVSRTSGAANFKISLTWRKPGTDTSAEPDEGGEE